MYKFRLLLALLFFSTIALAQGPKWPEDPALQAEAKRRFAMSVDEMQVKRYKEAIRSIQWLEKNTPELYDGLYIHGYKAYEEVAKAEADKAQKQIYLDSMAYFYSKKGERFSLTDREKNNLAYRYYKYWKTDKSKIEDGLNAYAAAYKNLQTVINNNIVSYMDMVRRYRAFGFEMSNQEVLNIYAKVTAAIEIKAQNGGNEAKLDKYRGTVNGLLTQIIGDDLNCEFIDKNIAPPLDDHPNDVKLAKKVFGLLLGQKCGDSPYFIKSAEIIQANEPTEGIAKVLADRAARAGELEKAKNYYQQAISLAKTDEKKADIYLSMAKIFASQKQKAEARKAAQEAAKLDKETAKEAYSLVGNLYMGSFNDCKKDVSQVDDRAVFMAAYDMFQKAGDQKGMAAAKAQFPTVSDAFTANKQEGDPISVGCWIGVKTTIKTRPSN